MMKNKILNDIKEALMRGDRASVTKLTKAALDAGVSIPDILNNGLIAGMDIIGNKFKNNEVFISRAEDNVDGGPHLTQLFELGVKGRRADPAADPDHPLDGMKL